MTRSDAEKKAGPTEAAPGSLDPTSQQIVSLATAVVSLARSVTVSSCFGMLLLAGGLVVPDISGNALASAFKNNVFAARVLAVGAFMLGALLGQWFERFLKAPRSTDGKRNRAFEKANKEQEQRIKMLEAQLGKLQARLPSMGESSVASPHPAAEEDE